MARISGIDLPRDKRVEIGLTAIFGIGLPTSKKILAQSGISPDTRVKDLTTEDEHRLREIVDELKVEGDLRREIASNIKRLTDIGCYRGLRHRRGLAGSWAADEDQCSHAEGAEAHRGRQEEGRYQEVALWRVAGAAHHLTGTRPRTSCPGLAAVFTSLPRILRFARSERPSWWCAAPATRHECVEG